ncbi:Isy1p [Rhodotorula paludigena]|uniref:Isy1p n=1 Tax=Rhodotorula paludigena TaxID=86838 RepID=UPI003178E4E0
MLYRFREAQAAELGLAQKTDRRPRVASSCKDLRQCERWRGEILREISRKVSKIQDAGLTDYEVRDLNDQINKLLREKHHWENQIVSLGGANYKRAAGKITDADGREIPGQRGYKYFGRARDLPGVRELFASAKADADELESYKTVKVTMFDNAPPEYYGNAAEEGDAGKELLEAERKAELAAWEEALDNLDGDIDDIPSLPLPSRSIISLAPSASAPSTDFTADADASGKRKAPAAAAGGKKKAKLLDGSASAAADAAAATAPQGFESVFDADMLRPPQLLSAKEVEKAIVERQKRMLLDEYGVEE